MDYLVKLFKQRCREEFGDMSFKSYRNGFYRVVNDILQCFGLKRSVYGMDCTVEFEVTPLCIGSFFVDKTGWQNGAELRMFERSYGNWFPYDRNSESSMQACVEEMIGYMKKYLIPHFESACNPAQAYSTVFEFTEQNCNSDVMMANIRLFGLALKAGMYDKAVEHLKAMRKQTLSVVVDTHISQKRKEELLNKIKMLDYEIKMISECNLQYIQKYITEKEEESLHNLGMIK